MPNKEASSNRAHQPSPVRGSLGYGVRFVHIHLHIGVWLLREVENPAGVVVQLVLQVLTKHGAT